MVPRCRHAELNFIYISWFISVIFGCLEEEEGNEGGGGEEGVCYRPIPRPFNEITRVYSVTIPQRCFLFLNATESAETLGRKPRVTRTPQTPFKRFRFHQTDCYCSIGLFVCLFVCFVCFVCFVLFCCVLFCTGFKRLASFSEWIEYGNFAAWFQGGSRAVPAQFRVYGTWMDELMNASVYNMANEVIWFISTLWKLISMSGRLGSSAGSSAVPVRFPCGFETNLFISTYILFFFLGMFDLIVFKSMFI